MSTSPSSAPAFENKSTCSKCNTSFNLFTRKHHCRQCGRTFCDRCSSWNIPLPHFGFSEPVRVDEKCYQAIQQQQRKHKANSTNTQTETRTTTETETSPSTSASTPAPAPVRVRSCTCNMPLCICPPDEPTSADEKQNASSSSSSQSLKQSQSQTQSQYATKDKPVSRPAAATKTPTTTSSFSGFVGFPSLSFSSRSSATATSTSTSSNTNTNTNTIAYDLHGDLNEQCRDAIKQGDTKGTEYLLKHGAKPNYVDRTGNTLLHLACMFDRWDTVCMFLSAGGDVTHRNPSGETPLDLAPPALQHKIQNYFATQHNSTTRPNPDKQ